MRPDNSVHAFRLYSGQIKLINPKYGRWLKHKKLTFLYHILCQLFNYFHKEGIQSPKAFICFISHWINPMSRQHMYM